MIRRRPLIEPYRQLNVSISKKHNKKSWNDKKKHYSE